jgi:SAM-dependent methyltransferase
MIKKTLLHVGPSTCNIENTTIGFNDGSWSELRYDIDPGVQPDIIGSMTDMSTVLSSSIDAIFSSHNIEHLYPHEVSITLAEFLRVLKPDGFVVLTCPDLQSVAKLIAEDKLDEAAYQSPAGPIAPLDILYGHRAAMARGNLYMAHRCGFTGKTLIQAFLNADFKRAIATHRESPCFDLWIVATKEMASDKAMLAYSKAHFPHSSGQ